MMLSVIRRKWTGGKLFFQEFNFKRIGNNYQALMVWQEPWIKSLRAH